MAGLPKPSLNWSCGRGATCWSYPRGDAAIAELAADVWEGAWHKHGALSLPPSLLSISSSLWLLEPMVDQLAGELGSSLSSG